ncbi:acetyltransferase [uncultured Draconibacterium sp.]|uniref:acetyltransferase n=1 Tax=uncultured Draconibacterium sp. TaxID=1573823 RepID=UPI0025FD5D01|nr:acetyltransferase [uncultured Draconibacterium sp.]
MKEIVLFGIGPMAVNVFYCYQQFSKRKVAAFTVDDSFIQDDNFLDKPVVPFETVQNMYPPDKYEMFVAMSYSDINRNRELKCKEAREKGYKLGSFIHPNAAVFSDLKIGDNCFVAACVSVQPNVVLGNNVFLRDSCNIGHDTRIADNCYIGGGASISGCITIKKNVFLGKGTVLRDGITIAENCIIGAGVTMLNDTCPGEVFVAPKPTKLPFSSEGFLK